MSDLKEQLALALTEAREAFEKGDTDAGEEKTAEAEKLVKALEGLQKLEGIKPAKPEPMRPPLPDIAPPKPGAPATQEAISAAKVVYDRRFAKSLGTSDYVKSALVEIEDAEYAEKYLAQKAAFLKAMRYGPETLDYKEQTILREVVMTPDAVVKCLDTGMDPIAYKATLVEARDTLGGYTVPVDFQLGIISRLPGLTVVRPRADVQQTNRDRVEILKQTGGGSQYPGAIRETFVTETPESSVGLTNPTFGLEAINIHTGMTKIDISRNQLEDTAFNLESWLQDQIAVASAINEDNAFLVGEGVRGPQGIIPNSLNELGLTSVASGSAAAIEDWDKIIDVTYGIDAQYRRDAAWIAEKATYKTLAKLKQGESDYYWDRDQKNAQPQSTLEGYPVLEQEGMPTIAAAAVAMIFGDLKGYSIRDRVGMTVERFLGGTEASENRVRFVARRRYGGSVTETWRFVVLRVAAS